jgi:hypothetical protein
MMQDITDLYHYLKNSRNVEKILLIGYRLGASIIIPLLDIIPAEKVILIDPVLNPIEYLKDALRANLTSQMTRYKKIIKNRDALVKELCDGQLVNVDGFMIGKNMWQSFEKYSPLKPNNSFRNEIVLVSTDNKKSKLTEYDGFINLFTQARLEVIQNEIVLTSWKHYTQRPPAIFGKIMEQI